MYANLLSGTENEHEVNPKTLMPHDKDNQEMVNLLLRIRLFLRQGLVMQSQLALNSYLPASPNWHIHVLK
jgi:hypothetical protein